MPVGSDNLGERIKQARLRAGLTLKQLGERIGRDHSTLSRIEKGANAEKGTIIALGRALNDDFGEDWLSDALDRNGEPENGNIENLSVEEFISLKFGIGEPKKISKARKTELIELAKYLDRKLELEVELEKQNDERK